MAASSLCFGPCPLFSNLFSYGKYSSRLVYVLASQKPAVVSFRSKSLMPSSGARGLYCEGYTAKRLQLQPLRQPSISVRIMSSQSHSSFVKDLLSSPAPALCLGFAGAIPFCSLAVLSVATPEYMDIIAQAQCAYGATIISFLGAVHWGFALAKDSGLKPDWVTLGYSVSPSLVACVALLLKPGYGLMTLNLGLLYALTTDLATAGFPVWYYALRKSLSTLAVTSVLITLGSLYLH